MLIGTRLVLIDTSLVLIDTGLVLIDASLVLIDTRLVLIVYRDFRFKVQAWTGEARGAAFHRVTHTHVQGYLAHKKSHPPLGPQWGPRHVPTVGS